MKTDFNNIDEVKEFLSYFYSHYVNHDYSRNDLYQGKLDELVVKFMNAYDFCTVNGLSFGDLSNKIAALGKKPNAEVPSYKFFINSVQDIRVFCAWQYRNYPIRNCEIDSPEFKEITDYHFVALMESLDFCYENKLNYNTISSGVYQEIEAKEIAVYRDQMRLRHPEWFEGVAA